MNKRLITAFSIALTLAFTGCSESQAARRNMNMPTGVKEVLASRAASGTSETEAETTVETTEAPETTETTPPPVTIEPPVPEERGGIHENFKGTEGIDIDLTKGNANLVYAQVYSMMYTPEEYIGKKVKMQGQFTFYKDETTGKYYYACFISDAAACCTQGIEFIPSDKVKYPDDFPKVGAEISVTGVFYTYKEGDSTFAALKDAKFKVV